MKPIKTILTFYGKTALLCILFNANSIAQVIFSDEQIINPNAGEARCVYAVDLNNDGNIDVLSASYLDDKIAWYQNDGNGNFSNQQIIIMMIK